MTTPTPPQGAPIPARRVTIADVARRAEVSRQTVSNAVREPGKLTPQTLTRVRSAIDDLGYRPSRSAQSLRTGQSRLIGLRVDPVLSPSGGVLDRFLHALADEARAHDYQMLVFSPADPADDTSGYRGLLKTMSVDAFVLTNTHRGDPRQSLLASLGTPAVQFGRPWDDGQDEHCWVDVDGAAGTRMATEHLIEGGHRRIAFLGWPEGSGVGDDRRSGWIQTMHRHGLDAGSVGWADDELAPARLACTALLDQVEPPTAVVCASDTLAMGALHAARSRSLDQLAVTGFDDSPVAALSDPLLTSVRQPLEQVAVGIVRMLSALLGNTPAPTTGVRNQLLQPDLVVRSSTPPL